MPPEVRVVRTLPTDPSVRGSESLFLAETASQGRASRELLSVDEVEQAGVRLIVRRRLMSVDGVPVRISNSYFPSDAPEADQLKQREFVAGGLQKLFEASGRRFGRAEESFTARMPTAAEREQLRLQGDDPVVHIVRTSYDAGGAMVHRLESICAASRHVFEVRQLPDDRVF